MTNAGADSQPRPSGVFGFSSLSGLSGLSGCIAIFAFSILLPFSPL